MNTLLIFWVFAYFLMFGLLATAIIAVRFARLGKLDAHAKWMNITVFLVILFVLSYGGKLLFLGRESLEIWEPAYVIVLRIHEFFIALMLIFGTLARLRARSFKRPLEKTNEQNNQRKNHKKWGKIALISTGCGWLTAGILLYGMFDRA